MRAVVSWAYAASPDQLGKGLRDEFLNDRIKSRTPGFDGPDSAGCILYPRSAMKFQHFSFGQIRIDGVEYGYDVVIDRGKVGKRKKKASKKFREAFGHTPLSLEEEIPWKCSRLVVGTGEGALPVMDEVKREAKRRKVELLILPTEEAMEFLNQRAKDTNAILHVTC